jgi:hypothetical protein
MLPCCARKLHESPFFPKLWQKRILFLSVIPNPRSEGTQERDLTIRLRRHERNEDRAHCSKLAGSNRWEAVLFTSLIMQKHRKAPLSPACGGRVRDDKVAGAIADL